MKSKQIIQSLATVFCDRDESGFAANVSIHPREWRDPIPLGPLSDEQIAELMGLFLTPDDLVMEITIRKREPGE